MERTLHGATVVTLTMHRSSVLYIVTIILVVRSTTAHQHIFATDLQQCLNTNTKYLYSALNLCLR